MRPSKIRDAQPLTKLQILIRTRLKELGINPTEAARRVGAQRTFVADVLAGRKRTIRADRQSLMAAALELDVADIASAMDTNPTSAVVAGRAAKRFDSADADGLEWLMRGCFEELGLSVQNSQRLAQALIKEARSGQADSTSDGGRKHLQRAGSVLARHCSP